MRLLQRAEKACKMELVQVQVEADEAEVQACIVAWVGLAGACIEASEVAYIEASVVACIEGAWEEHT